MEPQTNTNNNNSETRLAVMGEKINNIEKNVSEGRMETKELKEDIKNLSKKIDDTYATKAELTETQKDVEALKNNIGWAVKIVIGIVITAVIGLVVVQAR